MLYSAYLVRYTGCTPPGRRIVTPLFFFYSPTFESKSSTAVLLERMGIGGISGLLTLHFAGVLGPCLS